MRHTVNFFITQPNHDDCNEKEERGSKKALFLSVRFTVSLSLLARALSYLHTRNFESISAFLSEEALVDHLIHFI